MAPLDSTSPLDVPGLAMQVLAGLGLAAAIRQAMLVRCWGRRWKMPGLAPRRGRTYTGPRLVDPGPQSRAHRASACQGWPRTGGTAPLAMVQPNAVGRRSPTLPARRCVAAAPPNTTPPHMPPYANQDLPLMGSERISTHGCSDPARRTRLGLD